MWVILLDLPAQCAWVRASSHSGKLWHERLTKSKIARGRKFNSKKSSLPCSREEREEREREGEEILLRRWGLRPRPGDQLSFHWLRWHRRFPEKEEASSLLRGKTMNGPRMRPSSTNKIASEPFFFSKRMNGKERNDASFRITTEWRKNSNDDLRLKILLRNNYSKSFFQICSVTLSFDSIAQSTCLKRRGPGVEPRISLHLFTFYPLSSASDLSVTAPWPTVLSN